ncbi:hypothetical protein TNCV_3919071 [Trichonephila clavipes]|nr:hypothetical protein TNCV_3919071 [Trichonephila clavipes]
MTNSIPNASECDVRDPSKRISRIIERDRWVNVLPLVWCGDFERECQLRCRPLIEFQNDEVCRQWPVFLQSQFSPNSRSRFLSFPFTIGIPSKVHAIPIDYFRKCEHKSSSNISHANSRADSSSFAFPDKNGKFTHRYAPITLE